jgi:mannobiose 2-epimerase
LKAQFFNKANFRKQLKEELTGNILPFWMKNVIDEINGGFYGAVSNDLIIHNEIPRSEILCARILWTYALAYRKLGEPQYLSTARWAYDYLVNVFWDLEYGGVYWDVDYKGSPVSTRKHSYAQAFAIFGLSEYYRATQEPASLIMAQELFHLVEKYAFDPVKQGYIECNDHKWTAMTDMRLSGKDLNCRKSMNTMLHVLEAYTNLAGVWDDTFLKSQLKGLLETFLLHIIHPQINHFKLFFDDQWHSLSENVSFGHDIEGSWLLVEAVKLMGDPDLMAKVHESAMKMAEAVYKEGLDKDGSLFHERGPQGLMNTGKEWWTQAEAVVGFYNAFQLTGIEKYAQAAYRCWTFIQEKLVDRSFGDWYKRLNQDGIPDMGSFKVGPWECPYHQSRACFELLDRLDE